MVLVGALVATLLGTGAFSRDNEGEDASMWLWTTPAGEIARVNGLTAATDARFELTDAAGNPVQIEQTDTHLLLRNITTGEVSAVDLSTLALTGAADTAPAKECASPSTTTVPSSSTRSKARSVRSTPRAWRRSARRCPSPRA
ncbi:hypothetical protein GCM10029992_00130 [Glycomyces albus]